MYRFIAACTAVLLLALGGVAFTAIPASAHTPTGGATCEGGVYAKGTNYNPRDTNTLTVRVDGNKQTLEFDRNGDLTLPIPQDGRTHTWFWSVRSSDGNPAFNASNEGRITCGEATPPPVVKKARWDWSKIDKCNCFKDDTSIIANRDKIKVTGERVTRTKWVYHLAGRVYDKAAGLRYQFTSKPNGRGALVESLRVVIRTTNEPCAGAGTPGPHPNLPDTHCRPAQRGC